MKNVFFILFLFIFTSCFTLGESINTTMQNFCQQWVCNSESSMISQLGIPAQQYDYDSYTIYEYRDRVSAGGDSGVVTKTFYVNKSKKITKLIITTNDAVGGYQRESCSCN